MNNDPDRAMILRSSMMAAALSAPMIGISRSPRIAPEKPSRPKVEKRAKAKAGRKANNRRKRRT